MHVIAIIGEFENVTKLLCDFCLILLLLTLASAEPQLFSKLLPSYGIACHSTLSLALPSECHMDFQMATDGSYEVVAGLVSATPQKIED